MTDEPRGGLDPRPDDDWEARLTKQVVRTIARYKEALGWTTPQLAERYSAAVGEPGALKPTTLNNLLAGKRRSIGLAEILGFARAFGVPAIALMVPLFEDGKVEAFADEPMVPIDFHAALIGAATVRPSWGGPEPELTRTVLFEALFSWEAQTGLRAHLNTLGQVLEKADPRVLEATLNAQRGYVWNAALNVQLTRNALARKGVQLPPLPPEVAWVEIVDQRDDAAIDAIAREVYRARQADPSRVPDTEVEWAGDHLHYRVPNEAGYRVQEAKRQDASA